MQNSIFRAILDTLEEHIALSQDHLPTQRPNIPLFDPRSPSCSLPLNLPDVASRFASVGLTPPFSYELNTLLLNSLNEDRLAVEQARQRLLEQLCMASSSPDPSMIPSLVQTAFDAFYHRSINMKLDAVQQEISNFSVQDGTASECGGSSSSEDSSSDDGDNDDEQIEEMDDVADEDDNAPVRPGEDIPPLDTKYLPIFEALHERGKVLTKPEKTYLVEMTGMTYRQITIWFQNRRRGELKEDTHAHVASSHAASIHSDHSSDVSEDELELERRFSSIQPDATFNIRSWCLASAAATKNDSGVQSQPLSPVKFTFNQAQNTSGFESDGDSDLTDSDEEMLAPPGLQAPSLTTSITTMDSSSDHGPATFASGSSSSIPSGSVRILGDNTSPTSTQAFSRLVKPLPSSRRTSPPARGQPTPVQQAPAFSFNFGGAKSAPTQNQFLPTSTPMPAQPAQFVTSNERGLTVEMDTTPPTSVTTLQPSSSLSAPSAPPISARTANSSMPASPPLSAGSPHSASSPTPSAQCATSPRPAIKPLPRRTGCAPRPRPPPRAGSVSTPATASAATPSSARSSVVLPPSSNPSLGNTTLGALLRPNPPPPKIPVEMEDRLSAMAGRMGVGSNPNSARRGTTSDMAPLARTGASPSNSTFPPRGSSFSFGLAPLPGASPMPGSTLASITEQQAHGIAARSPTS